MDGKFLSSETKNLLAQMGDDLVKLPIWVEPFDKMGFSAVINLVDKQADKYIPDNLDKPINEAITEAFNGNYDGASSKIGTALNVVIDIPLLNEDSEQVLFVSGVTFLVSLIKTWIEKKKVTKE